MCFPHKLTIRDYLKKLLRTLWREGESFSGKKPFGNSDWQYDIYKPLVERGYVSGELDEDGCLEKLDIEVADHLMIELIDEL